MSTWTWNTLGWRARSSCSPPPEKRGRFHRQAEGHKSQQYNAGDIWLRYTSLTGSVPRQVPAPQRLARERIGTGGNGGQMRAAVWHGARDMRLEDVPCPVPQPGEVLLRVLAAGICGSELSGYLGQSSLRQPPLIM